MFPKKAIWCLKDLYTYILVHISEYQITTAYDDIIWVLDMYLCCN